MLEYPHDIRKKEGCVAGIIYIYELIRSIEVLLRTYSEVERLRLVHRPFHLVDVPVCSEERCVGDTHVRTDVLHLLSIPEREGVVVSVCHKDTVLAYRVEVVRRHLHGCVTVASVVVIPVLGRHKGRYSEQEDCSCRSSCNSCLAGCLFRDPRVNRSDSKTDPYRE